MTEDHDYIDPDSPGEPDPPSAADYPPDPPAPPEYLRIPTDAGDALIPIGLEDDDLKRLLAAIELFRSKIVTIPVALPATSLPADYIAPEVKAAMARKRKRAAPKKTKKKPPPVSAVVAPMAPATPAPSTEGRQIEEDGYLMDRTPG